MADVLARIVARKKVEVAGRLGGKTVEAVPTRRSLVAALRRPGARFIMEVKPRSPSGHVAAHAPLDALDAYQGLADAVSVLTDEEDFGGSLGLLRDVRSRFDGPILAKDFIVDPAQVREARQCGADAVLCMLSVLDDRAARAVMDEARALAMDVLVEVHDEQELGRAIALGAMLIGINNRDLKTLRTDLDVTRRLAPLVPDHVCLVSESGIHGRGDVLRIGPLVHAFLVGSHLMAAPDIHFAARTLVHGPVKICGLTNSEDVMLAAQGGASHAGLILVPDTPRALSLPGAQRLAQAAHDRRLRPVGVFRDAPVETVASIAERLGLAAVQLHGAEDEDAIAALRERLPQDTEIWAACRAEGGVIQPARMGADRTLFDNGSGGTGTAFDWSLLAGRDDLPGAFLAGGIGPSNARAAGKIGAFGLDIGSAVEARPGKKDPAALDRLFAALRAPARETI